MGQNNTGVVMRSGAETTLRYLQAKKKNRKTLTLKKTTQEKRHFRASADFSGSGVRNAAVKKISAVDSMIPVLTSPVTLVAAENVPLDAIPVLENCIPATKEIKKQKHYPLIAVVFLVILGLGLFLVGGDNQEQAAVETLSVKKIENGSQVILSTEAESKPVAKVIDKSLIKNIVELIHQEKFSQDSTIEAFLSLWQQVDGGTRATLNSSPWFLRFVFSLQKQTRLYLQSPNSYNVDYTIRFSPLLKMAIELGVMDKHGIESSIETYHSKQNELVETLKSEIAHIENTSKKQGVKNQSIEELNKSFRERFAVKPRNAKKSNASVIDRSKMQRKPVIVPEVSIDNKTTNSMEPSKEIINDNSANQAVELDKLVNRFIEAYEQGNLEKLTALFSPTARTNDKNNLENIRQDYKALFNSSSFRLLNIFNLRWESGHNAIKGIGDYEIGIAMDNSGTARTLHGKIQFVIGKVNSQLRITRLYHLER